MKRYIEIVILTFVAALVALPCSGAEKHPRLFADDAGFEALKLKVQKGDNEILTSYHDALMNVATTKGLDSKPLEYKFDASGKRILSVSRNALLKIFSAAYAWRFTGDRRYLSQAERNINTVCDFKDWNPKHYLDCAEMACAVAIGYDWLYNDLADSTRRKVIVSLKEKAFDTSLDESCNWWYESNNNWCQVCNAGLSVAALAVYEKYPTECSLIIEKAVRTVSRAAEAIYAPDGAYSEGPGYWDYGTMFQTLMLSAFESVRGCDYDICKIPGFDRTGYFVNAMVGNTGKLFNYGDNSPKRTTFLPLWYLAWRFNRPELAYSEKMNIIDGLYDKTGTNNRLLPLYIIYAARIDPESVKPMTDSVYSGESGGVPVFAARTGWNENDLYLGVKGGFAASNHGHMDAGSFVFEAYGVRWASDPAHKPYPELELMCSKMGGSLWNKKQDSARWQMPGYSNLSHNTLTVNGHLHDVSGKAGFVETFCSPDKTGVYIDMTEVFKEDLSEAFREVYIKDGSSLCVRDSLISGAGRSTVRWNLVTESEAEMVADGSGILLRAKGHSMKLTAKGADVSYGIWQTDPVVCGYEIILPPMDTVTVSVSLETAISDKFN